MVTTSDIWGALEAQWRNVLAEEGLAEFHAVDCRHRKGAFSDRRWAQSSERLRVRDRFLGVIQGGVAALGVTATKRSKVGGRIVARCADKGRAGGGIVGVTEAPAPAADAPPD
jgi:hypothetical protein